MKKYKKQVTKLKKSTVSSKKVSGCRSPAADVSLHGYSSMQKNSVAKNSQIKQSMLTRPYSSLQSTVSKEPQLARTATELGISRIDRSRGIYDPHGLKKIKESLGQRKKSFNDMKTMTMPLKQPTTFKNSPQVLYEEFQAAKNELKIHKSGPIS